MILSLNLLAKIRGEFYSDESQNSEQLLKFFTEDLQILFYQYIKNEISIDVIIDSLIFYRKLCVNCLQDYIDLLSHLIFTGNQEPLTISTANNPTKTFVSFLKNFLHSPITALVYLLEGALQLRKFYNCSTHSASS
jgi:hypothetical protein